MYVIKNAGRYVGTAPRSKSSYTTKMEYARKYPTREAAQAEACGNETVLHVNVCCDIR